ncbi:hypothetical protein PR048_008330 [Dryococelus australis]|uniref:Uncharacterized protein n=1 Tax=Dryococelus australis TaxID=614101 RepID=A0ABQ9HWU4_9NEOP|nr:hypothetical protein PR048_008330 [Dryococelus australis]
MKSGLSVQACHSRSVRNWPHTYHAESGYGPHLAKQFNAESTTVAVILLLGDDEEHKKRKWRSVWAKHWLQQLCKYSLNDYKMYLRMSSEYFGMLLWHVEPLISKRNTVIREAIPTEETGRLLEDLKFSTAILVQALGKIIPETCDVIFEVLREEYIKERN